MTEGKHQQTAWLDRLHIPGTANTMRAHIGILRRCEPFSYRCEASIHLQQVLWEDTAGVAQRKWADWQKLVKRW